MTTSNKSDRRDSRSRTRRAGNETRSVSDRDEDAGLSVALSPEALVGYDPALPARAKGLWLAGDWEALTRVTLDELREVPGRGELLMLIASAMSNLDRPADARALARKAMESGCSKRFAALVLTAGVHNTLGRIAALRSNEEALEYHFRASVNTRKAGDTLPAQVRSVREMARIGLLPQAAKLLERNAWALDKEPDPFERGKKIKRLKLETDLLKQQVALAVRNGQVFKPEREDDTTRSDIDPASLSEAELERRSTAQLGQDIWVLKARNFKRGGFFVEFGATDGVLLSNTYMLERYFGWDGLLAEPNPGFLKSLNKNRSAISTDACIHAITGEKMEFVFADVYGGLRAYDGRDSHADRRLAYAGTSENVITVTTISLNDYLERYGAPREIDYISIDTEGNELEILESFPFDKWKVHCWTVEHNFTKERDAIKAIMLGNGYRRIEASHDDWYVLA